MNKIPINSPSETARMRRVILDVMDEQGGWNTTDTILTRVVATGEQTSMDSVYGRLVNMKASGFVESKASKRGSRTSSTLWRKKVSA